MELLHRYLTDKFDWYEAYMQLHDRNRGHVHISPSLVSLLKQMDRGQDARIHMLAIRMGVTRRRVSQIVTEGVECGILSVRPDPDDGRASIVSVTDGGSRVCEESILAMRAIETELGKRIGRENVAELLRLLRMDWGPPFLPTESPERARSLRLDKDHAQ